MTALEKFQDLLRELFEFECADLDFGIYRIMNYKRQVIEDYINKSLPNVIKEKLCKGTLAKQKKLQNELEEARQKVIDNLGEEALDTKGNLAEQYHNTKVGREYMEARKKAGHTRSSEALENDIYNHLYAFFSRYYQDGDFISKRRYSKKERYAIPYNGEEVYLYWANHDQYYVKTSEYFQDYVWKAPDGVTVHFKLKNADEEQNNVKGDKRFFIPQLDGISWDMNTTTLIIPFEYRPLTQQETITYGNKQQQDKIVDEMLTAITEQLKDNARALMALTEKRRVDAQGNSVSFLAHHLRQYTARNTRDFFIHKDLKNFLSRELDFYLKNEVLNLEEMEKAGEEVAEGWFQLMQLIKRIGNDIIDFLAQIEDFQKMLWEKKKFVTDTFYCIAVGNIPEEFYPEIAENESQWEEWRALFGIEAEEPNIFTTGKCKKEKRADFLKYHPTLVVDTRHFSQDFTDRLLASFENLDDATDGVLIHSENWQALNLLFEKYRSRIKCIYIDPPYNSKTTEILYKNNYKHSSWLSLLNSRLQLSLYMEAIDGSHIVAIDENEQERLGLLLVEIFPNHVRTCVTIVHNKKGIQGDYFSYNHDYAYFCIATCLPELNGKPIPQDQWEYMNLRKWGRDSERQTAKNCFYPIYVANKNEILGFGDVCPDNFHPKAANMVVDIGKDVIAVYPIDSRGIERKWRYSRNTIDQIQHLLKVHVTRNGEVQILKARDKAQPKTVWDDPRYIAGDFGTRWLTNLGLKLNEDLYPKSVYTIEDSILAVSESSDIVLDYFAGSGTTAHAVINLNREDCGKRKFILVEMADYFDTVLLPRIKKVTFTPEWKDGKPKRMATPEEAKYSPRIVKVIRLESYEDALNNITFQEESGQQMLHMFGKEYLLGYMIKWEAKESETLLDVDKLQTPFDYKLHIRRDGETRIQAVDLPETFSYLLGLDVETRKVYNDNGRRYLVYRGNTREGKKVAVIWRETKNWKLEDYETDAEFVKEQKMAEGVDKVFVNGDSCIANAQSLDGIFKARMFAGMEA